MYDPYTFVVMVAACFFGMLWAVFLILIEVQLIVHFHLYFG